MKPLTQKEVTKLKSLLRRAIANYQFNLAVAVPYSEMGLVNDGEFEIDDTHSGNAFSSNAFLVDNFQCEGEEPVFDKKDNQIGWKDYKREELTVYIQEDALESLMGVKNDR